MTPQILKLQSILNTAYEPNYVDVHDYLIHRYTVKGRIVQTWVNVIKLAFDLDNPDLSLLQLFSDNKGGNVDISLVLTWPFESKRICTETATHTYVMTDKSGLCKIGKSKNIEQRLRTFQCGNPTIQLLYHIEEDVEAFLHDKFQGCRVNLEWFKLKESDLLWIQTTFYRTKD